MGTIVMTIERGGGRKIQNNQPKVKPATWLLNRNQGGLNATISHFLIISKSFALHG